MLFRAFLTLPSLKPATNSISCYCKLDLFNAIGFCFRRVWLRWGWGGNGVGGQSQIIVNVAFLSQVQTELSSVLTGWQETRDLREQQETTHATFSWQTC